MAALTLVLAAAPGTAQEKRADVFDRVTHGYAVSDGGVKIHYATLGKGPLVVMIHGFPDFWYSWRDSDGRRCRSSSRSSPSISAATT